MKRRNRFFVLCLAVLLLLPLFGCAEQPYETVGAITDWEDDSSWVMARFYSTSALSDEGYYFPVDDILYFADTSNGIAVCLCSKPGCLHEKGSPLEQDACDAKLNGTNLPMFFWNDHFFFLGNDEYGIHIYRRNADGTAQMIVADIGSRYVEERKALQINDSAFLGDYFYYSAQVMSPVLEEGVETSVVDMVYIGRLNLKTNKEEILVTVDHEATYFSAVCPDGLLYFYYEDTEANYEDEDFYEQRNKAPAYVQFYDFETKETTTILQRTYQEIKSVSAVRGSKLYYLRNIDNYSEVWEYDMETGSDRKVCNFNNDSQIDGRLVLKRVDGISVLYHLPSGQFLPTAFAGERLKAVCVSDDSVILQRTVYEGGRGTSATYCYVKLADLADGMQEEDVLDLYTYYYRKSASSYEEMVDQWYEMYE